MSEQGPPSFDPNDPTEIDAKAAFAMGAESSNASQIHDWQPPDPAELDALLNDYDVGDLLGRGGMGAVYKAVQKNLDRTVAIKLLPAEIAQSDPSFAERFKREAKAMAALDHPNIVTVFDFGVTSAGHSFFVMEFVDGMDFHQLIHSGQLDAAGALNAVSQICDALEYAHQQGYVHRDIKPANIFINQKGILKVGDFGLAKIVTGDESKTSSAESLLTQSGISMGTPVYSAPEQMDGRPVDQRADIYSLGVMFYEMLTHELPRGHFQLPSQKVQVDVRLDQVVLRAMESEPERRYPNVSEMRTEVEEVRSGPPRQVEPAKKSTRFGLWLILVGVAVAGFFVMWPLLNEEVGKPSIPNPPAEELASHPSETLPTEQPIADDRFGLPAFHGELRPIPGTAGWRAREPGELVAIPIVPNPRAMKSPVLSELPSGLTDVISATYRLKNGFAIRADGSVVAWGEDVAAIYDMPRGLSDVVAIDGGGIGTIGMALHKDGTVTVWGGRPVLAKKLRERSLEKIVSISTVGEHGFMLVDSSGQLIPLLADERAGWSAPQNSFRAVHDSMTFRGGFGLDRGGKLMHFYPIPRTAPVSVFPDIPFKLLSRDQQAVDEDGRLWRWKSDGPPILLAEQTDFIPINNAGGWIRHPEKGWLMTIRNEHSEFAEAAVRECSMIIQHRDEDKDWVLAIRKPQESAVAGLNIASVSPPTKLESIANGKGRPTILSLDPTVPDPQVPLEFDGIVAASVPPEHRETLVRDHRTCFVRKDGTGWDFNAYTNRLIHKMDGVRDVALDGADHCWLSEDSEMIPWPGTREDQIHAIPKGPFSRLEAGHTVYFGLGSAGDIAAWPVNEHPLKHPPELENVVDLDGGKKHAIALTESGDVVCWGVGFEGSTTIPSALKNVRVVSVGAVDDGSIAITETGEVVSWGGGIKPDLKAALDSIADAEKVFTESAGQKALAIRRAGKKWFVWVNFQGNGDALPPEQLAKLEGCDEIALGGRFVVGLRDVPTAEDPNGKRGGESEVEGEPSPFRGSLRAWSNDPSYPVDLSKAEGIDDFVQVIAVHQPWEEKQPSIGWAALRANGQVASSSGKGEELQNVTRLIEGRHSFGVILEDGSITCYDNHGIAQVVLEAGEHPVDAALNATQGLAILKDGSLRSWDLYGKWPVSPESMLDSHIRDVGIAAAFGCALTDEGRIVAWDADGGLELPSIMQRDVDEMVVVDNRRLAFRKGNDFQFYVIETGEIVPVKEKAPVPFRGFKLAHEGILMEGENGERIFGGRSSIQEREFSRRLSDLPEDSPYATWISSRVGLIFHIEPRPQIQGSLRAWASPDSDLQFDVSKAEEINDFVQVVQFVSGSQKQTESADWAALRANGRIVSSDGRGESIENVVKLIPGAVSFGAITESGQAIFFRESDPQYAPLQAGERAVDAAFAGSHGLAILEDGSLKHWGNKYEGVNAWLEPPEEVLSAEIARVKASGLYALAVTENGELFVWGENGQVDLPEHIRTGIAELDGHELAGFAVRKGDSVWEYVITQRKLHRHNLPDGEPVTRLHPQARIHHLLEGEDSGFHFPGGSFKALAERLTALPENAPHASAAVDLDGTRVEMMLYIEPKKPSAASPLPLQGTLSQVEGHGDNVAQLPDDEFIPLFNGTDLEGWEGDSQYWSVEDGIITGECSDANAPKYNKFLIWEGGEPGDFELNLEYRIESGNSGIQYRSARDQGFDQAGRPKTYSLTGYQADIDPIGGWTGGNHGEGLKMTFAKRGERAFFEPNQPKKMENIGDASALLDSVTLDDWNEIRIIAKGPSLRHFINGQLMSEVIDNRPSAPKSGLLGLQLHRGKAMKVQFRNIRLKHLQPEQPLATKK